MAPKRSRDPSPVGVHADGTLAQTDDPNKRQKSSTTDSSPEPPSKRLTWLSSLKSVFFPMSRRTETISEMRKRKSTQPSTSAQSTVLGIEGPSVGRTLEEENGRRASDSANLQSLSRPDSTASDTTSQDSIGSTLQSQTAGSSISAIYPSLPNPSPAKATISSSIYPSIPIYPSAPVDSDEQQQETHSRGDQVSKIEQNAASTDDLYVSQPIGTSASASESQVVDSRCKSPYSRSASPNIDSVSVVVEQYHSKPISSPSIDGDRELDQEEGGKAGAREGQAEREPYELDDDEGEQEGDADQTQDADENADSIFEDDSRSTSPNAGIISGTGTAQEPIELLDDTSSESSEPSTSAPQSPASTSRSYQPAYAGSIAAFVRPPPRRPDLSTANRPSRSYTWLDGTSDSAPSTPRSRPLHQYNSTYEASPAKSYRGAPRNKLRQQELNRKRSRSSILQVTRGQGKGVEAAGRRALKLFESPSRKKQILYQSVISTGMDTKKAYQKLMLGASFERLITHRPSATAAPASASTFASKARTAIPKHRESQVQDIIDKLKASKVQEDEEARQRLRPPVPTKMAPKRLARVRELLKDRSFHKEFPGGGQMNHGSMNRLKPEQWLDDECINSYGFMMQQRADQHVAQKKSNKGMNGTAAAHDSSKVLDMHYFNSFWYEKVKTHGHDGVRRWTKKVDLFSKDVVVFPINLGSMHWVAGVINMRLKRIEFYDSMGDRSNYRKRIFADLFGYLEAEYRAKRKKPFPRDEWTTAFSQAVETGRGFARRCERGAGFGLGGTLCHSGSSGCSIGTAGLGSTQEENGNLNIRNHPPGESSAESTPQQNNGSDCGVFTCQTLELISRGVDLIKEQSSGFEWTCANMPYIRQLMILELADGTLADRWPKEQE